MEIFLRLARAFLKPPFENLVLSLCYKVIHLLDTHMIILQNVSSILIQQYYRECFFFFVLYCAVKLIEFQSKPLYSIKSAHDTMYSPPHRHESAKFWP